MCEEYSIEFVNDEKVPRCAGKEKCKIASKEALIFFGSKSGLDIDGLGRETVETLLNENLITNFEDLYNLNYDQLRQLSNSIKNVSVRAYKYNGNTIDKNDFQERFGNVDNFRLIRHMVVIS